MDSTDAAGWLQGKIDELKQDSASSPLHGKLDALLDDFRTLVEGEEPPADATPQPSPA